MPGEGPGAAVRVGAGAGRRPGAVPGGRADRGAAGGQRDAALDVVPAEPVARGIARRRGGGAGGRGRSSRCSTPTARRGLPPPWPIRPASRRWPPSRSRIWLKASARSGTASSRHWPPRTSGWRPSTSSAVSPLSRRGRSDRACSGWSRAGARPSPPVTPAGSTPRGPTWPPGKAMTSRSRRFSRTRTRSICVAFSPDGKAVLTGS